MRYARHFGDQGVARGGMSYDQRNFDPNTIDYENARVQEIHMQLGQFNYMSTTPPGLNPGLESRQMFTLENHAKFEGQWISGTDIREGKGK